MNQQPQRGSSTPTSERPQPARERRENKRIPLRIMWSLIIGIALLGSVLLWVFSRMPASG
ncbi:hypothetical protein [Xanthomonas sp. XNM01]|jgi:hypothetical protein|uniref:hypothetical protein n=1 Tax=Xanthomonas sp. XNM01 TaxID=2769289 RepID=UPI0017853C02|nr:hypothetical protein [Xanthomonas sp. XNM01]MBD9367726.1 hypothetical protein [Xanthomonas sp. XNM01]